jgi:hypothetical protein
LSLKFGHALIPLSRTMRVTPRSLNFHSFAMTASLIPSRYIARSLYRVARFLGSCSRGICVSDSPLLRYPRHRRVIVTAALTPFPWCCRYSRTTLDVAEGTSVWPVGGSGTLFRQWQEFRWRGTGDAVASVAGPCSEPIDNLAFRDNPFCPDGFP